MQNTSTSTSVGQRNMSGFATDSRRGGLTGGGRELPSSTDQSRNLSRYSTTEYPGGREPRRVWPEETMSFDRPDYVDSDSNNSDERFYTSTSRDRPQPTRQEYPRDSGRPSANRSRNERYSGRGEHVLDHDQTAEHAIQSRYSTSLPNDTRSSPIDIVDPRRRGRDRSYETGGIREETAFPVSPSQDARYDASPRSLSRDPHLTPRMPGRIRSAIADDRASSDGIRPSTSFPGSRSPQRYGPSSYPTQRSLATLNERGMSIQSCCERS
jgi:hypothetical protein